MKKTVISVILSVMTLYPDCLAQVSSSRFYSLDNVKQRKAEVVDNGDNRMNDSISLSSSSKQQIQSSCSEKSTYSMEKLKSLIEKYEQLLLLKNDKSYIKSSNCKRKVYSYKQWNPRELNVKNLTDVMYEVGLTNKLFVLAQALLETGNFSSRVCREYNNLFGLYDSKNRDYYRFERWEDSVVGYGKMIQYRYKGGNYLHFLKRIGYAEDPRYITKVAKIAKSLYNSL